MGKCACKASASTDTDVLEKECGCGSKKKKRAAASFTLLNNQLQAMQITGNLSDAQKIRLEELEQLHKVVKIEELANASFILRLEKNGFQFRSGQYVALNVPGDIQSRHYSIYSGEHSETLDFLIKEVDNGMVSKMLHNLKVGSKVLVEGPWGHFRIKPADLSKKFLFIASGTGISPFHSFIKSYPELNYTLLHGIRHDAERYEMGEYPKGKYIACTSRDTSGDFHGRVTDYIKQHPVEKGTLCYLCGNNLMIDDVHAILRSQGISNNDIFAEIFF